MSKPVPYLLLDAAGQPFNEHVQAAFRVAQTRIEAEARASARGPRPTSDAVSLLAAFDRYCNRLVSGEANFTEGQALRSALAARLDRSPAVTLQQVYSAGYRDGYQAVESRLRESEAREAAATTAWRFAVAHSLPDHDDGNVRVERGAWERLAALLDTGEKP